MAIKHIRSPTLVRRMAVYGVWADRCGCLSVRMSYNGEGPRMKIAWAQRMPSGNVYLGSKDGQHYYGCFLATQLDCPKLGDRRVFLNGVQWRLRWRSDWKNCTRPGELHHRVIMEA